MARKKKAGKSPAPAKAGVQAPLAPSGAQSEWLLPALGALALVFSWLAALGGVSDGTMDLRHVFNNDTLWGYGIFRDMFLDDGYPVSGWRVGNAPFYFPDMALLWPLFALFGPVAGMYLFSLLQVFLAAIGWILICDRMFGKNPLRRCAVFLLQAATFLLFAWRESGLFMLQITGTWHYGAWACLPWLLWISMRMLSTPAPVNIAALVLAVAFVVPSDLVLAPWFVGPAAAAAAFSARPKNAVIFAAALAAGMALGWALYKLNFTGSPAVNYMEVSRLDPAQFGRSLQSFLNSLSRMAKIDPLEILLLPAFAAAVLWRAAGEWSAWKRKGERGRDFHARRFVLFFVPLSMAGAATGGVVNGMGDLNYLHPIQDLRYVLPVVLFPLFAGWALLAFPKMKFPPHRAALAACACAIALALPKAARMDFTALDPFATPFQKCFAEHAQKRGWTGAVLSAFFYLPVFSNPDAELKNYVKSWAPFGKPAGENQYMYSPQLTNWHRARGPFQVVVANFHQGLLHTRPPRAQDAGCPVSEPSCINEHGSAGLPLHDRVIRAAFGDPAEIVECAGVGLYHYDPPLQFGISGKSSEQALGNKF